MPHWGVLRRLTAAAPIGRAALCALAHFLETSEKPHGTRERVGT